MRTALVIVGVVGALVAAWAGRRPLDHHWVSARLEPQDGTNAFRLEGASPGGSGLELAVAYRPYDASHVYGPDHDHLPLIAASEYSRDTFPDRTISTFIVKANGADTLVSWPDRWMVCPLSPEEFGSDLLLWFPEAWYERASENGRADTIGLFRHNYAMDFKLLNRDKFRTSLEAAARGESLAVYSRLAIVGPDGQERSRIRFDPRFTADDGLLYRTPSGRVALIETDGGYANSDLFYMLFDQPRLDDGDGVTLLRSDDIDGNYRGLFTVDLEHGAPLWYRRLGVTSVKSHAVDLDRDGIDEILVETYCAENGANGSGTTDAGIAYLLCLDQGGNIIWRKRVLGLHMGIQSAAADVMGDERLEVVMVWSSGVDEQTGGVAIVSADGRTLRERTDLGGLYSLTVADLDGDGALEMATGGPDATIYILSETLEIERAARDTTDVFLPAGDPTGREAPSGFYGSGLIWRHRCTPLAACDINGDGLPDVIALRSALHRWDVPGVSTVMCGRGDIVAYDWQLNELARARVDHRTTPYGKYPFDAPASMKLETFPLDIDADGRSEIIVGTKGNGMYAFRGSRDE